MELKKLSGFVFYLFLLVKTLFAQEPKLVFPIGHTGSLISANFSADNKKIVTASDDGTARIWDLQGRQLLKLSDSHANNEIERLETSADGKIIITLTTTYMTNEQVVKVWNTLSGKVTAVYLASNAKVTQDGKKLVVSNGRSIKIIDPSSNKLLYQIKDHGGFRSFLEVNTITGPQLLSAPDLRGNFDSNRNDTIHVWDLTTGQKRFSLSTHTGIITALKFSKNGRFIVSAAADKTIKVWDAKNGELLYNITSNKAYDFVELNAEGTLVVATTLGTDKEVDVWNLREGKIAYFIRFNKEVYFATIDPAGKSVATASSDSTVVFSINDGKPLFTKGSSPDAMALSQDDKLFFSPTVYDLQSKRQMAEIKLTGAVKPFDFAAFDNNQNVITSQGNKIGLWDTKKGFQFTGLFSNQSVRAFNGKKMATFSHADRSMYLWDVETKNIVKKLTNFGLTNSIIDLDAGRGLTTEGKKVILWDINSGKRLFELTGHTSNVLCTTLNSKCARALSYANDGTIILWNTETGKQIAAVKNIDHQVGLAMISNDATAFLTYSNDKVIRVYNADGTLKHALASHSGISYGGMSSEEDTVAINFVTFSPNSKQILVVPGGYADGVSIWEVISGKEAFYLHSDKDFAKNKLVKGAAYSPDGEMVLVTFQDYTASVFNARTGAIVSQLAGHSDFIIAKSFSPDAKNVMTVSLDNTAKIWSASSGNLLYTFFAVDSSDYFAQLSNNYYTASKEATKLLFYVTSDLKIISFEQLDVKYNRPDKVFEAIGNTDIALIKSYRKAWEKRIKKLGIDTTAFRDGYSVPESDFTNRDAIEYEQKTGILKLTIKGSDNAYKLDRFNVWVNETPVFGQRGINIRMKNKKDFDTTISIKLSQGENRIETSFTNVNGTESYRMPLYVNYTPAVKEKETTRFIGIGIDQFADKEYNLQYSSKDIRDLSIKLKEKYKDDIIIDTLFNKDVTVSNVKALKKKLQQTSENDKVIIAYSGHGLLSKEYDYYLSTYAINFDKPEQNGLPYEELENLLDSIPARKKLLLIDACHSGEVDKDDLIRLNASSDSLIKGVTPVAYEGEGHLGLKNSFELMQNLFVNVGKSTGATIISAAAGTQFALERNDLKNGVFTFSILEAMNKYPTLKISELKKIVGDRVVEITKGLQKPTSRNETIAVDWTLW